MEEVHSSENSEHLTATRRRKQEEEQPLQIYTMHKKLWSAIVKKRHAFSTRVNNTKMDIIKIGGGGFIIYTELDFLRIGSSDWVLWTLKPEDYTNMGNTLTNSVSQIYKEGRS
jgi:hypothetical protein